MKLNLIELAWAAGFFDGEGTVGYYKDKCKPKRRIQRHIRLSVAQQWDKFPIRRFQVAVGGLGQVYSHGKMDVFHTGGFEEIQAIIAFLWSYLSPKKRGQTKDALVAYREHKW